VGLASVRLRISWPAWALKVPQPSSSAPSAKAHTTLRITFREHLTIVAGEPKVEREVMIVRGCP
jgi:hypothetical protein